MEKLCVVKTKENAAGKIISIILLVLAVLSAVGIIIFWPSILVCAVCVAAYLLGGFQLPVCYDYTYFGNELKIARIKGDSRRKLLHEINMDNVEIITAPEDPSLGGYANISGIVKKDYTSGLGTNKIYRMVYKDAKQIYMIDIEPSSEFIDALAEKYGRIIRK